MKNPLTGQEMTCFYETRQWHFRGENFPYTHKAWRCDGSDEQFTTSESADADFMQVTNQYRTKYGLPFTDEIIALRKRYGISAAKMSLILGMGPNQYRLYEQGEVPNLSNGRLILSIMNPKVMRVMVEHSKRGLSKTEYAKIIDKIQEIIDKGESRKFETHDIQRIFKQLRGIENGYAQLSMNRLKHTMLYILSKTQDVWQTKMNKLLFYTDFLAYREYGMAITGLSYVAIDHGPVPDGWSRVYSEFPEEIELVLTSKGSYEGCVLKATAPPDISLFSPNEIKVLDTVCGRLGRLSASKLSELSHNEEAWLAHYGKRERIPFQAAFSLKTL